MNNVYLDIETIPNQSPDYMAEVRKNIKAPAQYKKPESIAKWIADNGDAAAAEQVAKTSFDPALGHICCIGWALGDGEVQSSMVRDVQDEGEALAEFFMAAQTIHRNRIIGHYVSCFDIRFILNRAVVLGVHLPHATVFPRDVKPWGEEIFDTMTAWSGAKDRISQDNLCKALGLPVKSDLDGSMVAEAWANGEHDRIAKYCREDVETVRNIHRKFELVGY